MHTLKNDKSACVLSALLQLCVYNPYSTQPNIRKLTCWFSVQDVMVKVGCTPIMWHSFSWPLMDTEILQVALQAMGDSSKLCRSLGLSMQMKKHLSAT